jgi:hypothetical protein
MNRYLIIFFIPLLSSCDYLQDNFTQTVLLSNFDKYASCIDKWTEIVGNSISQRLCFEQYSRPGSNALTKITGTEGTPGTLFSDRSYVRPNIENLTNSFLSLDEVNVRFTELDEGNTQPQVVSFTFNCELSVLSPYTDEEGISCYNDNRDEISDYSDENIWEYSWSIRKFSEITLVDADFL